MDLKIVDPELPDELRDLVARALDRIEHEGEAALEAMCEEHPQHADSLRRRVSALRAMGLVEGGKDKQSFPEKLGEFRLIRQLGGGGMGVVYLAEQGSLGRTVALKLIRPENLYFPGARERFKREVDAVAKLQHPSIIPIYTVGEEAGIPYFAMEHIDGKSLSQCIAAFRTRDITTITADEVRRFVAGKDSNEASGVRDATSGVSSGTSSHGGSVLRGRWVQICLRIAREMALALAHAHERGVLHRDIKPSNVMLTKDGRAMLLDFGLAMSQDATRLTRSGALVGSMPYMAPEQVQGRLDDIGPCTDVYSLGVTLYELLTLRLPYANSVADELQRAIVDGQPETLSALNPAIPWDVETVCLTAMDADPRRRYPSAESFARDLTNLLELRPIEARRAGPILRMRRFVQRHPAASIGGALGLLILIGGPLVYGVLEHNKRLEIGKLNSKLKSAVATATSERERADKSADLALEAIDRMLTEVGDTALSDVPLMEGVRRRLLEQALTMYQTFAAERSDDIAVGQRVATAFAKLGHIQSLLGRGEDAQISLREAVTRLSDLAKRDKSDRAKLAVVHARVELCGNLQEAGKLKEADVEIDAIFELLAKIPDSSPLADSFAIEHGRVLHHKGTLAALRGDRGGAEKLFREATTRASTVDPKDIDAAIAKATWWNDIGLSILGGENAYPARESEIEDAFQHALATLEALDPKDRERSDVRIGHATVLQDLAGHYRRANEYDESAKRYGEALAELSDVVAAHPERIESRIQIATVLNNLGLLAEQRGQLEECEKNYSQAVDRLVELTKAVPTSAELTERVGISWMNLAHCAGVQQQGEVEIERLTKACEFVRRAIQISPENPSYRGTLVSALGGMIQAHLRLGHHQDAFAAIIEFQATRPESGSHSIRATVYLAGCCKAAALDPDLDDAKQAEVCETYAKKACEFVRHAKELDFPELAVVATKPEFQPLRDTQAFAALLVELDLAK